MTTERMRLPLLAVLAMAMLDGFVASAQGPPAPVDDILLARPFTLDEPYTSRWQAEQPQVASGHVVVLRVRPSLVAPRAGSTPVLCAGSVTVEWLNDPHPSGVVIGVVRTDLDPLDTLIWFARHGYPAETTAETIDAERQVALEAGVMPLDPARVTLALAAGGEPLHAQDRSELQAYADQLAGSYVSGPE